MQISNRYGNVEYDWKDYKKILFSFSGGADSTLLLWLSMNELRNKPDTILQVFTGVTPYKGMFKQFTSQENFDRIRSEFPDVADRVPDRIIMYNNTQDELGDEQLRLQRTGQYDLRIYALTQNPPYEVMLAHNLLDERVEDRDDHVEKHEWMLHKNLTPPVPMFQPFINIDKRFVAQCYEDFDLWRFYNNTISCERLRNTPDMVNNEEPCGHCWWCREKMMAFGMLDGGLK